MAHVIVVFPHPLPVPDMRIRGTASDLLLSMNNLSLRFDDHALFSNIRELFYNIPLLYGTTREFLKKFGFASLKDLPEVPEYEEMRREREEEGGQLFINFDEADESESAEE